MANTAAVGIIVSNCDALVKRELYCIKCLPQFINIIPSIDRPLKWGLQMSNLSYCGLWQTTDDDFLHCQQEHKIISYCVQLSLLLDLAPNVLSFCTVFKTPFETWMRKLTTICFQCNYKKCNIKEKCKRPQGSYYIPIYVERNYLETFVTLKN